MRIIAYTYQAATHCPNCATRAAMQSRVARYRRGNYDEHGIPDGAKMQPVFCTDETSAQLPISEGGSDLACDTCHTVITPHYDNTEENSR